MAVFDDRICLCVLAFLAEDELGDIAIQIVLELGGFVSAIDDPAVIGWIVIGLRSKFEAKVLDDLCSFINIGEEY